MCRNDTNVPEWFLDNLQPLGFEIWPNMIWDIDLIFDMWVYSNVLPIKF
jgi:hypothetical protein